MQTPTYVQRLQAQLSFRGSLVPRLLQRVRTAVASLVPSRFKAAEIHPHTPPSLLEGVPMIGALLLGAAILSWRRARRRFSA